VRNDSERLADILDAARKITIKVSDGPDAFTRDEYVQLALAHLVQIIGEAAARLSDNVTSRNPDIAWRQIIAMRNLVVHGYFDVDANILRDRRVRRCAQARGPDQCDVGGVRTAGRTGQAARVGVRARQGGPGR
jgi:uncharacterized protein with HEPN domain